MERLNIPKDLLFEDIYMMPYILFETKKVKFVPYSGYYYRQNQNSITHMYNTEHRRKLFFDSFLIWNEHLELYSKHSLRELIVAVRCLKIEKIVSHTLNDSLPDNSFSCLKKELFREVSKVLFEPIPFMSKVRYLCFCLCGKKVYLFIKEIFVDKIFIK